MLLPGAAWNRPRASQWHTLSLLATTTEHLLYQANDWSLNWHLATISSFLGNSSFIIAGPTANCCAGIIHFSLNILLCRSLGPTFGFLSNLAGLPMEFPRVSCIDSSVISATFDAMRRRQSLISAMGHRPRATGHGPRATGLNISFGATGTGIGVVVWKSLTAASRSWQCGRADDSLVEAKPLRLLLHMIGETLPTISNAAHIPYAMYITFLRSPLMHCIAWNKFAVTRT